MRLTTIELPQGLIRALKSARNDVTSDSWTETLLLKRINRLNASLHFWLLSLKECYKSEVSFVRDEVASCVAQKLLSLRIKDYNESDLSSLITTLLCYDTELNLYESMYIEWAEKQLAKWAEGNFDRHLRLFTGSPVFTNILTSAPLAPWDSAANSSFSDSFISTHWEGLKKASHTPEQIITLYGLAKNWWDPKDIDFCVNKLFSLAKRP
jgi:hypothetical protein